MNFESVVQLAIYNALMNTPTYSFGINFVTPEYYESTARQADAANGLLSVPIYDAVPQLEQPDSAFPYVTIGEDVHTTIDTDTELMNSVSITVHVWSRFDGRSEAKQIQGLIYNILHRSNLTYEGFKFVTITQTQSQTMMDADGHTRHGVQTFNLMIEEL